MTEVTGEGAAKVSEVHDKVIKIIAEHLDASEDQIKPETSFVNDLGADSLDQVELLMELEEAFDVTIPDEQAEQIQTVGDALKYIEENV